MKFRDSVGGRAEGPRPGREACPVSVIVCCRNEAVNLPYCLESLAGFDDVIVVDSASSDGSDAIASRYGIRVVRFVWTGGYPKKKQWALETLSLRHDWVLFVDADERVEPQLPSEIRCFLSADSVAAEAAVPSRRVHAAAWVPIRPVFLGRRLRFGLPHRKVALVHRRLVHFPADAPDVISSPGTESEVWDIEGHYQPSVGGSIAHLRHGLAHEDRKGAHAWFGRHNLYSCWAARQFPRDGRVTGPGRRERMRKLARGIYVRLPFRAGFVFVYAYALRGGFLDGRAGFHFAVARAFYEWQVSVKRLWPGPGPGGHHDCPCVRPHDSATDRLSGP